MNVEEAWNAFVKSQAVKKASIDEKLDVLASQMNEVQTTVDRLAETIPEAQGDAGAMEMANDSAMVEPNPEEALGEVAGAPEEEGVAAPGSGGDVPEAPIGTDEDISLTEEDLGEPPMAEGMPEMGGEEVPPLTEEEMDTPAIGESNDVISMVKEMIASEDDPTKLSQLSKILDAAVNTQPPQSNQSLDTEGGGMLKSDSIAKAEEDKTVDVKAGDEPVDTAGETGPSMAESPIKNRENEVAPKPATDSTAPVNASASADEPSPELMEKIMDAVKDVLVEFFGEASDDEIDDSAEEAVEDKEDVKIDDEDADVHIDAEEGSTVEVESDDEKKGEDEDDITDDEKIDRNEEFGGESFTDSCIGKSFADMMESRMATHVGIDGQFSKKFDPTRYGNKLTPSTENAMRSWRDTLAEKNQTPAGQRPGGAPYTDEWRDLATHRANVHDKGKDNAGEAGYEYMRYAGPQEKAIYHNWMNSSSNPGMTRDQRLTPEEVQILRNRPFHAADEEEKNPVVSAEGMSGAFESKACAESENAEPVAESGCAKTEEADVKKSTDNGKPIMSLKEMMAIQKSADRIDVASTSYGSLNPPTLEGAEPIKMVSFKDMMGNGNDIRKSIEADAEAYRLYKSQQNM